MKLRIQSVDLANKPTFDFTVATVTLGRDSGCEFPMSAVANVSGRHAQITLTPEGAYLSDLESTNGTFVNDRRINGRVKLRQGDFFRLGHSGPSFQIIELDLTNATQTPGSTPTQESVGFQVKRSEREHDSAVASPAQPKLQAIPLPEDPPAPTKSSRPSPTGPVGQTRRMVMSLQEKNRNLMIGTGIAVVVLLFVSGVTGLFFLNKTHQQQTLQKEQEDRQKEQEARQKEQEAKIAATEAKQAPLPEEVYLRTVGSTVYIRWPFMKDGKRWYSEGSGSLIDRDRRLVITAYHVIHGTKVAQVMFPKFSTGKPMSDWKDYSDADFIDCTIWASAPELDLAIIQLASVPPNILPLKLADKSPEKNATVHVVGGSPDGSVGLWISSRGSVKEVIQKDYRFSNGQMIDAWVIRTGRIVSQGNSGGPLVNDHCELVGVVSGGDSVSAKKFLNQDDFIDVRHVKEVLAARPQNTIPRR
jgi:pSer/pThr/pTyr-binding forkhead associated (FHA) protein